MQENLHNMEVAGNEVTWGRQKKKKKKKQNKKNSFKTAFTVTNFFILIKFPTF